MKTNKIEKLKTLLNFYYSELNSLKEKQHDMEVKLLNTKDNLEKTDNEGTKYVLCSTLPTCLGTLVAVLLPCSMAFSIPSFIISSCVALLSAYLAVPNYIKWVKNVKECDKLDKEVKELESKIADNTVKIDLINNKVDTLLNLINSYEKDLSNETNIKTTTETKLKHTTKSNNYHSSEKETTR